MNSSKEYRQYLDAVMEKDLMKFKNGFHLAMRHIRLSKENPNGAMDIGSKRELDEYIKRHNLEGIVI